MILAEFKTWLKIMAISAFAGSIILLAFIFLLKSVNAAALPTSFITSDNKIISYLAFRADVITRVNNKTLRFNEVKDYIRMLNIENKIRKLKGRNLQEFNQDILTRKL